MRLKEVSFIMIKRIEAIMLMMSVDQILMGILNIICLLLLCVLLLNIVIFKS